jgi:hypothetical protein
MEDPSSAVGPTGPDGAIPGSASSPSANGGAPVQLGKKALLFWGEGALSPSSGDGSLFFKNTPEVLAGFQVESDAAEQLPEDLTQYRVVFWIEPGAKEGAPSEPSAIADKLIAHAALGARLIVMGDWNWEYKSYSGTRSNKYVNALMSRAGIAVSISGKHGADASACPSGASTDPLATGINDVLTFGTTFLTAGAGAAWIDCPVIAVAKVGAGSVVVTADLNMFSTHAKTNSVLLKNLTTLF